MIIRILALFSIITLVSCAGTITKPPTHTRAEISKEQRIQADIASKEKIEKNAKNKKNLLAMQQRLLRISTPISQAATSLCHQYQSDKKELCIYNFTIDSNDDNINAYADGENIVITKAMMNFAKKDEELAVILGHEAAHNLMGHVSKTKLNATTGAIIGTLLDAFAESQGVKTGNAFTQTGAAIGISRYSVAFEEEADYVGLYITHKAGYDIANAANFWRRMSIHNPKAIFGDTTHPSNPKRFIALSKTIEEIKSKAANKQALLPDLKEKKDSPI